MSAGSHPTSGAEGESFDPERALRTMWASHQIAEVATTYAWAIDQRRWDDLDLCFLPDATIDYQGRPPRQGLEAIKDLVREVLTPLDASQHLVSTFRSTVDGDRARATCYFQAQHLRRGTPGGETFIVAGTYVDALRHVPEGWRIEHRQLIRTWTSGNPAVVVPGRRQEEG